MTLYNITEETATLHISKGNNKIGKGIWSFSTLPGNSDHMLFLSKNENELLTDIPGTCSKYCEGCAKDGACYAWRDAKLHHNAVIRAWAENTVLLRNGKVWKLLNDFLNEKNKKAQKILATASEAGTLNDDIIQQATDVAVVKTFRINVSGEIEDPEDLIHWNAIALAHPETTFGIYTKNFDALATYLDTFGNDGASNLVINVSEWHGVAAAFIAKYRPLYPNAFNIFEYDDHNKTRKGATGVHSLSKEEIARLDALPHCPAVTKEGRHAKTSTGAPLTCDICGKCYRKTGRWTAVWSH